MSPEQATAEKEITARSDVYSLGSVLYEMLTGNPPHVGSSAQQIIMRIITTPAEAVTVHRKSVPPNVAAAVAKSLEKLPADRFESAKAFGDALGNSAYTNARFTVAAATPALANRRRVNTAAGFVFTIVVTAAVTWWLSAQRAEAPAAVRFAFSTAPSQPLGVTLGRTVALSPDGRTLVYATADSTGRPRLFRRALDDLRQQPIAGTENAQQPFFSPDGRWLGFFDGTVLKKILVDGGTPTQLANLHGMWGASWGPNGIAVSTLDRLALVPSGGGTPVPLLRGDSTPGYHPVVLPGGKIVAYNTNLGAGAQIAVAVLSTGRTSNLDIQGTPVGVAGDDFLFVGAGGVLRAIAFDVGALRVTGSPRVVLSDVQSAATTGEAKASMSANGSLAYVSGTGFVQAMVVDMRGGTQPTKVPPGRLSNPRYSPDGRRVLVDLISGERTDVWIYDIESGAAQRVTSEGTLNQRAEWTPDGTRVLFRSNRGGRKTTIWWQPADGSGTAQELVASKGKAIFEGVLTPDGRTVVYRTGTVGLADIWYRNLAGDTAAHGIATTPFTEWAPRVSPDGRWIAYVSDESGTYEVYVRPFPGPGAVHPVSVGGGDTPVWSRDGRKIFFSHGNQFIAASVTMSPTFSVTARAVLFGGNYLASAGHASFDVSPDGKSFLMLRPVAGNFEEIIVVSNWVSELRTRAKSTGQP
jgi:serine/threonine-protein kinase